MAHIDDELSGTVAYTVNASLDLPWQSIAHQVENLVAKPASQ